MRVADWNDYELIDTSAGERLERWGDVILIRPDPQIIWNTPKPIRCGEKRMQGIIVPIPAAVIGRKKKKCLLCGVSVIKI